MKKIYYFYFIISIIGNFLFCQEPDSIISLDLMRVPSSPGFTILGINPTDVDRPTNPTDFWANIKKTSDNFSTLPKNYSIELAPLWLFSATKKFKDFNENKFIPNVVQSWMISIATNTKEEDSLNVTSFGVGTKISLARGHLDEKFKNYRKRLHEINKDLSELNEFVAKKKNEYYKGDAELQLIIQLAICDTNKSNITYYQDAIAKRQEFLLNQFKEKNKDSLEQLSQTIKDSVANLKYKRIGFKLDIAGGFSMSSLYNNFDSLKVNKIGLWVTTGYESSEGINIFVIGRYLKNIDASVTDDSNTTEVKTFSNFDIGASISLDNLHGFSISGEYIYRNYSSIENIKSKYKLTLNVSYEVGKNQLLTFTFGRNFEGKTKTGGNIIAALNLLLGFGSKRPF